MTALTAAPGSYRPAAAGTADRAIRLSTAAAVLAVAGIAAYVSYWHAYAVVRAYGESGITARLEPATIDGLVYASSMVILHAARHRIPVPALARGLLGPGIAATLTANMAQGWSHGPVGAVVAAWPAASLAGSYELLVWLIATSGPPEPEPPAERCRDTTACRTGAHSSPAAAADSQQHGDGVAHARIAAHHQGAALTGPDRVDEPAERVAFGPPVHQPRHSARLPGIRGHRPGAMPQPGRLAERECSYGLRLVHHGPMRPGPTAMPWLVPESWLPAPP